MVCMFRWLAVGLLIVALSGGNVNYAFAAAASAKAKSSAAQNESQKTVADDIYSDSPTFDYKTVSAQLVEIENNIKNKQFTRQSLDENSSFLTQQEIVIELAAKGIEKNSKYVQDALDALGPEPAEGETEDPAIAEMRAKYTAAMNSYKSRIIGDLRVNSQWTKSYCFYTFNNVIGFCMGF